MRGHTRLAEEKGFKRVFRQVVAYNYAYDLLSQAA